MPADILFTDLETFSPVDLPKRGAYIYAKHPETEILLNGWAINDGPVQMWDATEDPNPPAELIEAYEDPDVVKVAQNSNFDRNVLNKKLIEVPIEQWEDTMVIAYTLGMPGQLEHIVTSLGADIDFQKLADGKRLISMFCMPQKPTKNQPYERRDALTDPDDWENFIVYGKQDITSMRWAYHNMPQWVIGRHGRAQARRELELWHLSEKINDRGMPIDLDLARAAIELTNKELDRLNTELFTLTDGYVDAHSKREDMLMWLFDQGVNMKGYTKEDLSDALKMELPAHARRALEIRQEAGRTSTAKYQALIDATDPDDDRLRGGLQYYGAKRTGRYAGRRFQPHNLPHPEIPDSDAGAEAILNDTVDLLYEESAMAVSVSCVRSAIKAPPGKRLDVSDLSNIEGRTLPWLAGEDWKLQAFRDFDAGTGPDLYKVAYSRSFGGDPWAVEYYYRQIGKVQELSLQYQGGVGAFYKMAKKFGLNLEDMYHQVIGKATDAQIDSAYWMVDWIRVNRPDLNELSDEGIVGADIIKQRWRAVHPTIVQYWYDLEALVERAIENPGKVFRVGVIKAQVRDDMLLLVLPSGRPLVYQRPRIKYANNGETSIFYMNHDKGKWRKVDLYGGKIAENVNQAVARDVLTYTMPEIDAHCPIIGSVHDEDITENDIDSPYGVEWLNDKLATNPPWAKDLPLAAAGYTSQRYKKD